MTQWTRKVSRSQRLMFCGVAVLACVAFGATGPLLAQDKERVKELRMDVEEWEWSPNKIHVTVGTKVILHIKSYDATHRFDLKEWGLKVVLPQNKTTTVEFVADKVGTFKWKCGRPCGNGCPKMTGKIFVNEAATEG